MADFDFVQSADVVASGSDTSIDVSTPGNVTSGNLIVVPISRSGGGSTATVAKQSGTSTLSAFQRAVQLDDGQHIEIWWAQVTGSGSLTIRASYNQSVSFLSISCGEYVGPATGTELIDTASSGSVGTSTPSTGNCTFTAAGLLVGALVPTQVAVVATAGTDFTIREQGTDGFNFEDKKVASAGDHAATWSLDQVDESSVVAAAFQAVAGGGGTPTNVAAILQNYRNMKVM